MKGDLGDEMVAPFLSRLLSNRHFNDIVHHSLTHLPYRSIYSYACPTVCLRIRIVKCDCRENTGSDGYSKCGVGHSCHLIRSFALRSPSEASLCHSFRDAVCTPCYAIILPLR